MKELCLISLADQRANLEFLRKLVDVVVLILPLYLHWSILKFLLVPLYMYRVPYVVLEHATIYGRNYSLDREMRSAKGSTTHK